MFSLEEHESLVVLKMQKGKVQAMDLEFCCAVTQAMHDLAAGPQPTVVLTGHGQVFSAGVDLKRLVAEPADYVDDFFPALRRLFATAWSFPGPLVTAVNGAAVAGGCVLANAGDWRILVREAPIGMPEQRVGLPLPAEGVEIIRHVVAAGHLPRVLGEGTAWRNEAALAAGLADQLVEQGDLMPAAIVRANQFARVEPTLFRLGKQQLRYQVTGRMKEHHDLFGAEVQRLWKSPAIRETVRQFVQERL